MKATSFIFGALGIAYVVVGMDALITLAGIAPHPFAWGFCCGVTIVVGLLIVFRVVDDWRNGR